MFKISLFLLISFLFVACSNDHTSSTNFTVSSNHIYYGDIKNDEVILINIKTMEVEKVLPSNGKYPYEVANGFDNKILVINRDDTKIGILKEERIESQIELDFKPRSIALNPYKNLTLVSSVSDPAELIIEGNRSKLYSDSTYVKPNSYGGTYATGHPFWVNENYFLLLDRSEKSIELYKVGEAKPIDKIYTSSSVHHLVYENEHYFGSIEGERNVTSPGIIKFDIAFEKFTNVKEKLISSFKNLP